MMIALNAFMYYNLSRFRQKKTTLHKWGPFACTMVAALLIMAEPTRHVLGDTGAWQWCGDNTDFPRVNQTWDDEACRWSSTQYKCDIVCCVPADAWPAGHVRDVPADFDAGESCTCEDCVADESMSNLSMIGWLFTITFTYTGFAILTVGTLWNANIVQKIKVIRATWQQMRAMDQGPRLSINEDDDDEVIYEPAAPE